MAGWVYNPTSVEILAADDWGNNPATVVALATAVAALFAIAAVVVAVISWRVSRKQTQALEDEISDRMRPWIGLFGFEFVHDEEDKPWLQVLLRNVGPLPAQQARLSALVIQPRRLIDGEPANPILHHESQDKVLMPEEDGNYRIPLSSYRQLDEWIAADRDLVAKGTFVYALDQRNFESQFEAKLWFSKPKPSEDLVDTNWRNTAAT